MAEHILPLDPKIGLGGERSHQRSVSEIVTILFFAMFVAVRPLIGIAYMLPPNIEEVFSLRSPLHCCLYLVVQGVLVLNLRRGAILSPGWFPYAVQHGVGGPFMQLIEMSREFCVETTSCYDAGI
jgi:hypothetical protein